MANINFEKLLEYIVNGEQEKAEELFHSLVVNKSREIYEGLFEEEMKDVDMDEAKDCDDEDMEEAKEEEEEAVEEAFIAFSEEPGMGAVGGDPTDDMMGDVGADDDADGMDMDAGDEDEMGGEGEIEDRVMDLEDALDDLKAEFEKLMADEEDEPEHNDGENDPDFGGEEDEEEGEEEEEADESFNFEDIEDIDLSPVEQMREYVEKIAEPYKGGKAASTSETGAPNTKSPVAGKNDMGGTTANIAKGGEGSMKGTAGGLLNPTTKEDNAGNVNVPGAKSATKLSSVAKGHGAEKKGAGEDAQNKKSIIGSKG
jgi:hypothetical protein